MRTVFHTVRRFFTNFIDIYLRTRVPRSAAALSYYLTMTVFPVVIILYAMLGSSMDRAMRILNFAASFMSANTYRVVENFVNYVAGNNSATMLIAALTILVTAASASVRTLQGTIGEMQGGQRYCGVSDFSFSILFAMLFLVLVYFGMVVMLTGRTVMNYLSELLHFSYSNAWDMLRFVILFILAFVLILVLYLSSRRRTDRYLTFAGALAATAGIVGVCYVFSLVINVSAKYPLVYGSFTAIMLMMFWLYVACIIIFCGAAVNVAARDTRAERLAEKAAGTQEDPPADSTTPVPKPAAEPASAPSATEVTPAEPEAQPLPSVPAQTEPDLSRSAGAASAMPENEN